MIEILGVKYITDKEAANLYGYSIHWFIKRRRQKKPPTYVRLNERGKVLYRSDVLEEWFKNRIIELENS